MHTRNIMQSFWHDERLPWLELRSTWRSYQSYKCHFHPQLSIGAVLEGETCCICDGKEHFLRAGDLVVIPPQAVHSCNPIDGQFRSYHMLYLDVSWCLTQLRLPVAQAQLHRLSPVISDPRLFRQYLHLVELTRPLQQAQLTDAVSELLHSLQLQLTAVKDIRNTSQHVQERLQANLLTPPALDGLAQECDMCKETLIRTFKQDTGLTPGSYLSMARVDYARKLLRAGEPSADAGYQTGFADQSHFHRTFVSYTAATPRQYALSPSISDNK